MTPRRHALVAAAALLVVVPLAVLARIRWHPLADADRHVDVDASGLVRAHTWLLHAARVLTHFGDPAVVTAIAVGGAVVAWAAGRRQGAVYLLGVRAVAVVLAWAIKGLVRRARPVLAHPVAVATGFSFPSGHAFGSAAAYASVAITLGAVAPRPARWALAIVPPVIVAATRVLLGVHFVSDVVAGLVLGWSTALLLTAVLLRPADGALP